MKVTAKMLTQILLDLGYVFTPPDPEPDVQDNDSLIDLLNYSYNCDREHIYVNDTCELYTHVEAYLAFYNIKLVSTPHWTDRYKLVFDDAKLETLFRLKYS